MQIFKLRAGKAEFAQFHASTDWTINRIEDDEQSAISATDHHGILVTNEPLNVALGIKFF